MSWAVISYSHCLRNMLVTNWPRTSFNNCWPYNSKVRSSYTWPGRKRGTSKASISRSLLYITNLVWLVKGFFCILKPQFIKDNWTHNVKKILYILVNCLNTMFQYWNIQTLPSLYQIEGEPRDQFLQIFTDSNHLILLGPGANLP